MIHLVIASQNVNLYPIHAFLSLAWLGLIICALATFVFSVLLASKHASRYRIVIERKSDARIQTAPVRSGR